MKSVETCWSACNSFWLHFACHSVRLPSSADWADWADWADEVTGSCTAFWPTAAVSQCSNRPPVVAKIGALIDGVKIFHMHGVSSIFLGIVELPPRPQNTLIHTVMRNLAIAWRWPQRTFNLSIEAFNTRYAYAALVAPQEIWIYCKTYLMRCLAH